MREIKFRAKRKSGEWVVGSLFVEDGMGITYILSGVNTHYETNYLQVEVVPKTVGQFTGELDYDCSQIYEGDIVEFSYKKVNADGEVFKSVSRGVVEWHKCGFVVKNNVFGMNRSLCALLESCIPVFVIGNVNDNPELLECKP